jgi:hypothetical protein
MAVSDLTSSVASPSSAASARGARRSGIVPGICALVGAGALLLCSSAGAASLISDAAVVPAEPSYGAFLSCASATQCVAVGPSGEEATFNPVAPGSPSAVNLAVESWEGVACPSSSQCTAVGLNGVEDTFNPAAPASGSRDTVDPGDGIHGISCPSTAQCTIVDENADWLTFNPGAPGTPKPTSFGPRETQPYTVACPSATQCTEAASFVNTFNPTQAGSSVEAQPALPTPPEMIACSTSTQCTAVGQEGAVTFQPTVAGAARTIKNSNLSFFAVACPSSKQCTAVAGSYAVTFDPESAQSGVKTTIAPGQGMTGVSCPSTSQCTAIDLAGHELTFRPTPAAAPSASTNARKLAKAIKACDAIKARSKRASCLRAARKRYPLH